MRRRALLAASQMTGGVPDTPTEGLDYLTIIHKGESGGVYCLTPYTGSIDGFDYIQTAPFYFRINDGEWIEVKGLTGDINFSYDITLLQNDRLQLKCVITHKEAFQYPFDYTTFSIFSDSVHTVCGTPLSMCYGDDFANDLAPGDLLCSLFINDTGLQAIENPETFLHCKTLEPWCYSYMFLGCTNLQNAPVLPATTLTVGCYCGMFGNCNKLNYIKMLATDISASVCLSDWVYGVSSTGTFVKHPEATWDVRGVNGVPEGWTIKFDGEEEGGTYDEYFGQIPPESTSFEFPLYITVPFVEVYDDTRYYKRQADNLSLQLREWFFENAECTEDFFETYYELYPDNIYLNGVKVRNMDVVLYNGGSLENEEINIYLEQINSTSNVSITNKGELVLLVFT